MISPSKRIVVHRLLDFLDKYTPLETAHVMSLGGEGAEVGICNERGVSLPNVNIVERNPRLMHALQKNYPDAAHHQGSLRSFPASFTARYGNDVGLDLIHVDFCGTLEPQIMGLLPVLPLAARGEGRCLAYTVADKRRNLSLESTVEVKALARRTFGKLWPALWQNLKQLHRHYLEVWPESEALEENVALRELGALLYITLACGSVRQNGGPRKSDPLITLPQGQNIPQCPEGYLLVPDAIERFVYCSEDHWRMRTYVVHFRQLETPMPAKQAWQIVAELVTNGHCAFIAPGGETIEGKIETQTHEVVARPIPAVPHPQPQKERVMTTANTTKSVKSTTATASEKLADIQARSPIYLPHVSSEVRRDVETLIELLGQKLDSSATRNHALDEVLALVTNMKGGTSVPTAFVSAPTTRRSATPTAKVYPSKEETAQQDSLRVQLMRALHFQDLEAESQAYIAMGIDTNTRDGEHRRRAAKAQLTGDNRKHFFARVVLGAGSSADERVQAMQRLSEASGLPLDAIDKEVKRSGVWKRANQRDKRGARGKKAKAAKQAKADSSVPSAPVTASPAATAA